MVTAHLLAIQNSAGEIMPLAVYEDEFMAHDARQLKMKNPDVLQALELLNASYVVIPVAYHPR